MTSENDWVAAVYVTQVTAPNVRKVQLSLTMSGKQTGKWR